MDQKIFVGQTALRIQLKTGISLVGATGLKIKYKKPNGETGFWPAEIDTPHDGVIYYDVTVSNNLDQAGIWTFWAHVTTANNTEAPGVPVRKKIYEEGK